MMTTAPTIRAMPAATAVKTATTGAQIHRREIGGGG